MQYNSLPVARFRPALEPTQLLPGPFSPEIKLLGREAINSPPSIAGFKNNWS